MILVSPQNANDIDGWSNDGRSSQPTPVTAKVEAANRSPNTSTSRRAARILLSQMVDIAAGHDIYVASDRWKRLSFSGHVSPRPSSRIVLGSLQRRTDVDALFSFCNGSVSQSLHAHNDFENGTLGSTFEWHNAREKQSLCGKRVRCRYANATLLTDLDTRGLSS